MTGKRDDIFNKDIEVPAIVQKKAEDAFSIIRMEGTDSMKEYADHKLVGWKLKKCIKPLIAAAACAALIVVSAAAGGIVRDKHYGISKDAGGSQRTETKNNISAALPDFSITAYAADLDMADMEKGSPVFLDTGIGDGGYTGMLFRIEGEDISDVSLSINKGELYSATIENTTEAAVYDWLSNGAPDDAYGKGTHTVIRTFPAEDEKRDPSETDVKLYHCKKGGIQISEKYDSEKYYGFYIPDSITANMDSEKDLAAEGLRMLRVFDGSVLSVVITYSDGSSQSRKYNLTVKKMLQDENGVITQKEWTGGEGAFVYGIAAEEKDK